MELISAEALSLNKKKKSETNDVVSDVSRKIKDLTNELIIDLDNQIRSVRINSNYWQPIKPITLIW